MALNKLTADALVDGTLDADAIGTASVTHQKLHSNIISGQTAIGTVDASNDLLLIYDNNATSLKKVPVSSVGATNTDSITEGSSNLYYTNARADARAQLKIDALVDSAPGALNTLNELAAALGDDANFSTTVTNSIATKLPLAGGTMSGDIDGNGNKVLFANVYAQLADLPSASTYHGMFAHVHATNAAYYAHAGAWVQLADNSNVLQLSGGTLTGNLQFAGGGTVSSNGASDTVVLSGSTAVNLGGNITLHGQSHSNASQIFFKNGSTNAMTIAGGKVGIGTASPSAPLDVVVNNTVYVGEFIQQNTSNGDGVLIQVGSTAAADYALTVRSDAGNTSVLAAKADGNVGIGTFTPSYKLHSETSSGTDYAGYFRNTSGSGNSTSLIARGGANNTSANFQVQDYNGNADFTVTGVGKVGIGNTDPGQLLEVTGSGATIRVESTDNNPQGIEFYQTNTKNASIMWGQGNANLEIRNFRNDQNANHLYANIDFFTGGSNATSPNYNPELRMRITDDGTIGIGDSDPKEMLVVTGGGAGHGLLLGVVDTGGSQPTVGTALASIGFKHYTSGATNNNADAKIDAVVDLSDHSGTSAGTALRFYTKPTSTGPGSAPTEAVKITENKKIIQNGGGYYAALHNSSSAGFYGDGIGFAMGPAFRSSNYYYGNSTGSFDFVTMYASGHWGTGHEGYLWLITTYYNPGHRLYHFVQHRGGHITLSLIHTRGENGGCTASTVTNTSGGNHSGQSVAQSSIRISSGFTYENHYAVLQFNHSGASTRVYDSSSTASNVQTNAYSNGSTVHFLSMGVQGYPGRATA